MTSCEAAAASEGGSLLWNGFTEDTADDDFAVQIHLQEACVQCLLDVLAVILVLDSCSSFIPTRRQEEALLDSELEWPRGEPVHIPFHPHEAHRLPV